MSNHNYNVYKIKNGQKSFVETFSTEAQAVIYCDNVSKDEENKNYTFIIIKE